MRHFIELGSAYWDTLHEKHGADPAWRGLTVDARPELLAMLPNRANVEKLNVVVTDSSVPDGTPVPFFYVPHALVIARGFPQWLDGCGSTNRDHTILSLFSDKAVTRTDVPSLSVRSLLARAPQPDAVKTDLEGGDFAVVSELLRLGARPERLEFEIVHMPEPQRLVLYTQLVGLGYTQGAIWGDSITWTRPHVAG